MIGTVVSDDIPETRLLQGGMVAEHERRNAVLRALVLDMAGRIPDNGTNKRSGDSYFANKWLSARDLHLLPDPEIRALVALIEDVASRLAWPNLAGAGRLRVQAMWAIVSRLGLEGRPHKHSGLISGAYYVDAGACDDARNGVFAI